MPKPIAKNKAPSAITLSNSSIVENTSGGQIGILTVKDPDKGDTAMFTVSDSRFEVVTDAQGRSVLQLKSGVSLNYEAEQTISFSITATDSGGLSKTQNFQIAVTNVNEAPTDISLSNASVAENATGAMIGTLSGSDPEHNALSFSVVGSEASRFETLQDATTGQWKLALKAGVSLDYEQQTSVNVTVRASDGSLSHDEVLKVSVIDQPDGDPVRVSVASDGSQLNGRSHGGGQSVSADGHYVTYYSETYGANEVFVYDRLTGMTERISQGGGVTPSISADGRFVTYESNASSHVSGDTNGVQDIFVYDRQTGTTERVSVASDGTQANDSSEYASISGDGRYVSYHSAASNLVPGDTNGAVDIFVYDRQTGMTERVSVASDGTEANGGSIKASLSADGDYVTFYSDASNLVDGDTNGVGDIFVYDRQTGMTERVSVASDGTEANGLSYYYSSMSADGRFVTYSSAASNLVPNDKNGAYDIFVYDRQMGTTERVSIGNHGTEANGSSYMSSISADGRYISYQSDASNLVDGDTNGASDIFIYDRLTHTTSQASVSQYGNEGNDTSGRSFISADGSYLVFDSHATNLVENDTNSAIDVFLVRVDDLWA
jgi:VCBS repeat-containing protein